MNEILENAFLKIEISPLGAELRSIYNKAQKLEYLWQGDEKWWPRSAPVLFPVVGKLNGNAYKLNGENYSLSQHGFARDKNFEIVYKGTDKIAFVLDADAETLEKYPYNFRLKITYTLLENKILTRYEINNFSSSEMYFSIGAHPGFNCPLFENEVFEDYYIGFEKAETAERYLLENGLFNGRTESILQNSNILNLTDALFEKDAIVFKNLSSENLYLKSRSSSYSLKMDFKGFPYFGIWKKPGAPFLCLEPWCGLADNIIFNGAFSEKEGVVKLKESEVFEKEFYVEL